MLVNNLLIEVHFNRDSQDFFFLVIFVVGAPRHYFFEMEKGSFLRHSEAIYLCFCR